MIYFNSINRNEVKTITLTARIDTALCIGAGGSDGSLADKPIVRNAAGKLIIPGSQIKGRLRHECEKLAKGLGWQIFDSPKAEILCPSEEEVSSQFRAQYQVEGYKGYHCFVSQIFGNPILPSRIIVEDLVNDLPREDLPTFLRPGVTINRRRRIAEDKKLYFLETSPPHNQLRFTGELHLLPACPPYAEALILAALHHIHALGGSKSAGLGWLIWEELKLTVDEQKWEMLLPKVRYEAN